MLTSRALIAITDTAHMDGFARQKAKQRGKTNMRLTGGGERGTKRWEGGGGGGGGQGEERGKRVGRGKVEEGGRREKIEDRMT